MSMTTKISVRLSVGGMLVAGAGLAWLLLVRSTKPAKADVVVTADWRFYGNDPANTRFQDIDQINPSNAAKLTPAWVFHTKNQSGSSKAGKATGDTLTFNTQASMEMSPIVVNGTMFITDGDDEVFALNAATGDQIWAYHPTDMPPFSDLLLCCFRNNRGVAVGNGKVFLGRLDATLVALDAVTGTQLWRAVVDDFTKAYSITMAPQFIDGKVIVGVTGGEYLIRGHVDAYDARTGALLWRFFTTDPNSFAGESWKHGAGPVWQAPAFDPKLGMVYVTTGNVGPDINGQDREGMNLFTACIVALDIQSGKLKWFFQEVHHDLWDYDSTPPAVLFTLNGTPAIAHAGKTGFLFILDRRTGKPLFPVTEKPVPTTPSWQHPWPTQPESSVESLTPHSVSSVPSGFTAAPMWTPPQETPFVMQPGTEGGLEWPPMAYSPRTKFIYHGARYIPQVFRTAPGNVVGGTLPGWGSTTNDIRGIGEYGVYGAVNTTTGKIAWKITVGNPAGSGVLVAGDLVFFGEPIGLFHAVDAGSGKILWTFDATMIKGAGGADAAPIAYMVNGREFIANAFGGNPNEDPTILGDAVISFALPPAK